MNPFIISLRDIRPPNLETLYFSIFHLNLYHGEMDMYYIPLIPQITEEKMLEFHIDLCISQALKQTLSDCENSKEYLLNREEILSSDDSENMGELDNGEDLIESDNESIERVILNNTPNCSIRSQVLKYTIFKSIFDQYTNHTDIVIHFILLLFKYSTIKCEHKFNESKLSDLNTVFIRIFDKNVTLSIVDCEKLLSLSKSSNSFEKLLLHQAVSICRLYIINHLTRYKPFHNEKQFLELVFIEQLLQFSPVAPVFTKFDRNKLKTLRDLPSIFAYCDQFTPTTKYHCSMTDQIIMNRMMRRYCI